MNEGPARPFSGAKFPVTWSTFVIFSLLLSGASYLPLSGLFRTVLASLAFGGAILLGLGRSSEDSTPRELGFLRSNTSLFVLGFLLVLSRSFHLTTLPFWPIGDEGILSSLAIDQVKTWRWDLLVAEDRQESLGVWALALFFKLFEPSLFSIRLFPALISLFTCSITYWAARRFFPRSLSFLICAFFGFSFWEFTFSRLCMRIILLVLVQCLCYGLLGDYLRKLEKGHPGWVLLELGIAAGIGFYTFTSWPGVWLGLLACFVLEGRKARVHLGIFSLISGLIALPMFLARLSPGGLSHIQENFAGNGSGFPFFPYLRQIFWDGTQSFPFGSDWGGLYNPLAGALVLTGAWTSFRRSTPKVRLAFGACLFFSALPAALSQGIELHRLAAWFPLLTVLAAFGVQELATLPSRFPSGRIVLVLLGLSGILDAYNFVDRYSDPSFAPPGQQWRSVEYQQAYTLLKDWNEKKGPILFFSEFNTDYDDKTLMVASYPFDGLQRSGIRDRCTTAALLLHPDYAAFLESEFPGTKVHFITGTTRGRTRTLLLAFVPLVTLTSKRLETWIGADQIYRMVDRNLRGKERSKTWESFSTPLLNLKMISQKDKFLASIFWEKLGFLKVLDGEFAGAAQDYHQAISKGIPMAHLYHNLALCYRFQGNPREFQFYSKMEKKVSSK